MSSSIISGVRALISRPQLAASFWTTAGNLVPRLGIQKSPIDIFERIQSAAEAGFTGFGFLLSDMEEHIDEGRLLIIRKALADHHMHTVELEFLTDWFASDDRRERSDKARAAMLIAAVELGASHIKVTGDRDGFAWPQAQVEDSFGVLCDEAEAAGTSVALELTPWSNIRTIDDGDRILRSTGRKNAGLLLDIWHLSRAGEDFNRIRCLPRESICSVDLNDACKEAEGALWEDTVNRRKLCGEGELDLVGFLTCLQSVGYSGPFFVEIISSEHRSRSIEDGLAAAFQTSQRALDSVYWTSPGLMDS